MDQACTLPTAKELRDKLGLSKGYASDLTAGKRRPSLELAFRIEREFGVPVSHWAPNPADAEGRHGAAA